jgi:hypothetical protein
MGGAFSEPIIFRQPRPPRASSVAGVSVAGASGCKQCVLELGNNVSTSVVTIQRVGDPNKYTKQPGFELAPGKLLITPDKPFEFRFNGTAFTVSYMTIYRPSPIRVENIQADAVLSLNDYHTAPSHVILIPLSTANTFGVGANFVDRIMANVTGLAEDDTPMSVSVGNDWTLNSVLPTAQDKSGKVSVSVPFFKWSGSEMVEKLLKKFWFLEWYGWVPREGDTTTILLKDPVAVSGLTSAYLQALPYVPSEKGAPGPMPGYVYQQGKCLTCASKPRVDPAKLEELQSVAKAPVLDPKIIDYFLIGIGTLVVAFFAIDFALKGWGESGIHGVYTAMKFLIMPRPKPGVAPAAPTQ